MTLVEQIREALKLGHEQEPMLVGDDAFVEPMSGGVTPAAVLIPIVEREEPGLILTLRPETMRRHAGQIAFPGGRVDPGDSDAVDAALREAEEEIALTRDRVEIIGTSDRYRTITGFEVTPVVGLVPAGLSLKAQAEEVAAIFEAPLDFLLRPENHSQRLVDWQGRTRRYFEIAWQDRVIWGATAAMIVNLSRRLARLS